MRRMQSFSRVLNTGLWFENVNMAYSLYQNHIESKEYGKFIDLIHKLFGQ